MVVGVGSVVVVVGGSVVDVGSVEVGLVDVVVVTFVVGSVDFGSVDVDGPELVFVSEGPEEAVPSMISGQAASRSRTRGSEGRMRPL